MGISAVVLGLGLVSTGAFAQELTVVDGDVVINGHLYVVGGIHLGEGVPSAASIDYEEYVANLDADEDGTTVNYNGVVVSDEVFVEDEIVVVD